ncbi:SWIM zinc finger family protein [Desulfococcaceae bacterium HSG9]|nr:SWIM zinc finger family protein [Desulfococcaceae bacterium HSG9]
MIDIDTAFIDSVAANANAIKNGKALIVKKKFLKYSKSADETLIFSECKGSGATHYYSSADFIVPEKPVFRCSCPSRQFPCKHCIGLMYAYVGGNAFKTDEVPEDITRKREKAAKRVWKKKETSDKPRKVNKSALKKKMKAQLDGLDLLETMTLDLIRGGLGSISMKTARLIEEQAKQLGNAYLPGAQYALHDFTSLFYDDNHEELDVNAREAVYSEAIDRLIRIQSLCKHGRQYLNRRIDDPELTPETGSGIAALLGHAWQLRELKELGLMQADIELVQLSFNAYDNTARKQFIETGAWINLADGHIQQTHNIRPYRSAQFIKKEDSVFKVVKVNELYIYPGDMNPRIRWDGQLLRKVEKKDMKAIRSFAQKEFLPVIKSVKNQLKAPLADKYPLALLWYENIGQVGDQIVITDASGKRLVLGETAVFNEPESCGLLNLLNSKYLKKQVLLGRFYHDLDRQILRLKPLTIVSESEIVRLIY